MNNTIPKTTLLFLHLVYVFLFSFQACSVEGEKGSTSALSKKATATTSPKGSATGNNIQSSNPLHNDLLALSRLYLKYQSTGTTHSDELKAALSKIKHEDLSFVKQFVLHATQQSKDLLSHDFLKKPARKDLQHIYLLRRANWNTMSLHGITPAVLDTFEVGAINHNELLTAYYRLLFDGLQLARSRQVDFSNINIDLNKLNLNTAREKAILFYIAAELFSRKFNMQITRKNKEKQAAKNLLATFPKINGQDILEAEAPPLEDFRFMLGNGMRNKSFKEYFSTQYQKAKEYYRRL
ncbi:MAG TPA: hypothetical protein ENJ28_08570 [Gammaproteobacteria bacterium]|nr:hypothetical protein [Gammaproteobacteria bacterium]